MQDHVAIVGGGQAAASAAARLRRNGFVGAITLFAAEPHPPYQRPPLSKKYLGGEWGAERLWLHPPAFWAENRIELRLGTAVTAIDPVARTLTAGGATHPWTHLILATGTRPRPLPAGFAGRSNVFEIRTLADIDRFRPVLRPGARLAVLGGGYIGLETAAVARLAGMEVTVIERAPRILERVASPETATAIRALHAAHGVRILEGRGVAGTTGAAAITGLTLDDGTRLDLDAAVVGIGVLPETALAEAAGIACGNGIAVDGYGCTSVPGVWAAGDCACFGLDGLPTRLESVQNAIGQAEAAADDICGQGRAYAPVPWFWSDQYDAKLQIAGLSRGYEAVIAKPSDRGLSHWYLRGGRLIAVDALNDARAFMAARKLLEAGIAVTEAQIADPDFDPARLLKAQRGATA